MAVYTVTASNCWYTYTARFTDAQDAYRAAYWYGWSMDAAITTPDGRKIHGRDLDTLTDAEHIARSRAHFMYYEKYNHLPPKGMHTFLDEIRTDAA